LSADGGLLSGVVPVSGVVPAPADLADVTGLLGRVPNGNFSVVVRRRNGAPVVIANDPHLRDGEPMPTRYWLVDPEIRSLVGRLEAQGGVRRAEAAVAAVELEAAHTLYARERDALIRADWQGPRPHGGVGGTRRGVKCLHAHVAWWLAGGDDPVARWVAGEVEIPTGDLVVQ
jgi:hypothetical protein